MDKRYLKLQPPMTITIRPEDVEPPSAAVMMFAEEQIRVVVHQIRLRYVRELLTPRKKSQ